jgi:glycosyltransferase involved in cell wall biosynthesis
MSAKSSSERIRILHAVHEMKPGGVEIWLMHMLRHIDRSRFQMDFVTRTDRECLFEPEIRDLGGMIHRNTGHRNPLTYRTGLRRILTEGRYQVVHGHLWTFSGLVLRIAQGAGVRCRIAHSHNDRPRNRSWTPRGIWERRMAGWIEQCSTDRLACSPLAASALFGPGWDSDPRTRVLPYSIDLAPFEEEVNGKALRAELGIPESAQVLGHVGSFTSQKNHDFLLRVFDRVSHENPEAVLLLVGDGVLRPEIERQVDGLAHRDRVVIAGIRTDVPAVMAGAMDAFVFPSHYEGLGLVAVEAQAAGLPCICADGVPDEATVIDRLVVKLPLEAGEAAWAAAIGDALLLPRDRQVALAELRRSSYDLGSGVSRLEELYRSAVDRDLRTG